LTNSEGPRRRHIASVDLGPPLAAFGDTRLRRYRTLRVDHPLTAFLRGLIVAMARA
jgi:hypothetical protein